MTNNENIFESSLYDNYDGGYCCIVNGPRYTK